MNKMDEIKLTLENEGEFYRQYLKCKIRDTEAGVAGKSVDVQRREIIASYLYKAMNITCTMRERIELQQYFDERYNLCPYGLRSQAEMEALAHGKEVKRVVTETDTLIESLPQPENQEMTTQNNTPTIETKTFIGGVDAATMTDEQIFKKIREIENEVADLKKTEHKPKKLEAKIAQMEKAILDLVAYVDEREAK